ncbi:MAG: TVP38/TMEM64 family protein [Clostridia bacterium]|nr:TVP38/TMEM64 family protein [Clostridia bacterium]
MSEENRIKIRKRNIKLIIAAAVILAFIIFLLTDTGKQLWSLFQLNGDQFKKYIESKGRWGPILFFLLSYLQVVIAPIPGQVTYFVGGMLFGTWGGFLINHTATILASVTVYWLGRAFGEPLVDKLAGKGKTKKAVDFVKRNGPIFFLLAFVIPGLPDDLLCYIAGIVTLPFGIFLFLVAVARIPSTLSSSLLGNGVLTWTTGQTILVIGILAIFIGLVVVFRKPITNLLNKLVRTKSKDQDVDITDMME